MTKSELTAAVAASTGFKKKDAEAAVAAVLEGIESALIKGDKVQIAGFGSFAVKTRAARKGRNPFTGKAMDIGPSKHIAFAAGKTLKEKIK